MLIRGCLRAERRVIQTPMHQNKLDIISEERALAEFVDRHVCHPGEKGNAQGDADCAETSCFCGPLKGTARLLLQSGGERDASHPSPSHSQGVRNLHSQHNCHPYHPHPPHTACPFRRSTGAMMMIWDFACGGSRNQRCCKASRCAR